MYASILEWCIFPFTLKHYIGTALNGDKQYGVPEIQNCYRADNIEVIKDKYGKEYASGTQLYIPGTLILTADDVIVDGKRIQEIHKLGAFYDGTEGTKDLQVIYL